MTKFRLIEDWISPVGVSDDIQIMRKYFDKGYIFSPNENNKYLIEPLDMELDISQMRSLTKNGNKVFEEILEKKLDIIIEEVPDDDDIQIKNWRIQLDVNTTRKKLKEIEIILRRELNYIL